MDDTDFKTAETGLTIANTDIKLVVNGGASADKNAGGGTHRVNGVYGVTFDATDTATVGELFVSVKVAGALPVFATFVVVEEEVYDDLFAASAVGYLKPTTAGRDLDVSAGGEAGIDWANIGSPTTTVGLSGTTVKTATDVETDTQDIQSRLPAALSSGNMKVDVLAISGDTTAADNAESFFDGTGYAGTNNVIPTVTTVNGLANNTITAASIAANAITAAKIADAAIDAATFAADVDAEILSYLVDDATRIDASALNTLSGHDPGEAIMGATDLGTGSGLTSLATQASVDAIDDFVDTEVAAIKAKTDSLTFTVAGVLDANVQYVNDVEIVGDGSGTPFNV